jgi:U3 small nucleolar RNA-associated protein 10
MLKAQLAQSASLNAIGLQSNKSIESYLFSPQEARLHDLDSILHLAQNGLQLLISTSGSKNLRQYKTSLIAPSAKFTDRTKLSAQENATLDGQIESLLLHISPFLTEPAASRIIEWLIRRYR